MKNLFKFAWKNVFRKRGIAILAILGITVGIGLMITLNGFSEGINSDITREVQGAVGLVEIRQANVSNDYFSSLAPDSDTQIVTSSPEREKILSYSRELIFPYTVCNLSLDLGFSASGNQRVFRYKGFDGKKLSDLNPIVDDIVKGRMYSENTNECVIPDILKDALPEMFDINKTVEFIVNRTTDIVQMKIVGVYRANIDAHLLNMIPIFDIFVSIKTAQQLWSRIQAPANLESHDLSRDATVGGYTVLIIKYDSTRLEATEQIAENLKKFLDAKYPTVNHQVYAKGSTIAPFEIIQSRVQDFLVIISLVTILAGGMSIIIAQLIGAERRMKEFAVLKATGWTNGNILSEVVLESLILSVLGGLCGFGVGLVAMWLFSNLLLPAPAILTHNIIIQLITVTVTLGIVGGAAPAIRAARVRPVAILHTS